jgi:hypothetical protein
MYEHVVGICTDREITVRWCKRLHQSHAMYDIVEIVIAPIKSAISYEGFPDP